VASVKPKMKILVYKLGSLIIGLTFISII